jgi:hypothetical protein
MGNENLENKKYKLEKLKALSSFLLPLALVFISFQINSNLKDKEYELKTGQQIIKAKQEIYAEIGKHLNVIFVYIADVGDFRKYTPLDIINRKREVDRLFNIYLPFWSYSTRKKYNNFMHAAFLMGNKKGKDALIKANMHEKMLSPNWNKNWEVYFKKGRDKKYYDSYYELIASLLADTVSSKTFKNKN